MKRFLDRHPLLRRVLLAGVTFYVLRAAVLEGRASRQYREVEKWPAADAVVKSSNVFWTSYSWTGRRTRYCPKLQYTYAVRGQQYEEFNEVFDFICWPDAYDFVSKHQPGSEIRIAYDPHRPAISVVPEAIRDPGFPSGDVFFGIIFAGLLVLDLSGNSTKSNNAESMSIEP